MNPKEFVHKTAYSVQLPDIAGHFNASIKICFFLKLTLLLKLPVLFFQVDNQGDRIRQLEVNINISKQKYIVNH